MSKHERYEQTLDHEISGKSMFGLTVGLFVLVVVSGALMWGLSVFLRGLSASADPPPPAMEEARAPYTPPSPRLQTDPVYEMNALRESEAERLESYGWVDEEAGIGQIPIERALELYATGRLQAAGSEEDPEPEVSLTETDG